MRKQFKLIAVVLILCVTFIALCGCAEKLPKEETLKDVLDSNGYKVVFEDDFSAEKLNEEIWINGYPTQTRSAAYYTEDAVFLEDGNLIIRTNYRENGVLGKGWYTGWIESADSTSHIMQTTNDHVKDNHVGYKSKYGYFEARLKVPKFKGMWSAFWLMPVGGNGMHWDNDIIGTATDGVEVDIMESFYYSQPFTKNSNTHVIHMDSYKENLKSIKSPLYNIGSNIYDEFHTYGVLWTENEYVFYIDGKESWRYDGGEYGIAQVEECILLTCEVPGYDIAHPGIVKDAATGKTSTHWSGDARQNDKKKNYDFVVDYVKVYKK